jgi:glycosyltransferase involved in cell wall biosynthesis
MTDDRRPLRIAIVYDCLYPLDTGGGERVYRAIADRLIDAGHEVDYLTRMQWDGSDAPHARFRIRPIWRGDIADASGDRRPLAALGFAAAVFRALVRRRRRYDLVIASALPPLNVPAARLALLGSATWLVGDWLEVWPFRKWREYSGPVVGAVAWLLQTIGLRSSDEITANSRFTLRRAAGGMRPGGGIVLGLVDLVGDAAALDAPVDRRRILFAGRHIADKQLQVLPAAMRVVRRTHPDARLTVTGAGPETAALLRAAEEADVSVDLRGRVPGDELEALMGSAAVLVNPSRREGFGLVVAEAASHGTPSVVVRGEDNAATELVEDGVNGFVASSTAPEELGQAIVRAIDGGDRLRISTRRWFEDARIERNLGASLDELLERYAASRTR